MLRLEGEKGICVQPGFFHLRGKAIAQSVLSSAHHMAKHLQVHVTDYHREPGAAMENEFSGVVNAMPGFGYRKVGGASSGNPSSLSPPLLEQAASARQAHAFGRFRTAREKTWFVSGVAHGDAAYNETHPVTLKGPVAKFEWADRYAQIYFEQPF